ncbi:EAL domain-containing protein [Sporosarcina sp. ACRSL]|uniref:EAL domain-containing protein n=1 Tax=Sporosarcina sp. ACRSL TaxID=2918215 RepID=UPI001EF66589|nr:EAL domain-containing protein [Sporosarcina sp. ACRSL]MCG7342960.1 EAL domain-containing protein [Sporosarcina sp. ACRSL]
MGNWIVDHAHSVVGFEVKHMMVSKVRGQFDSFTANIEADDIDDLTTANIVFQFNGNSINTKHQERDAHLRSADFFDVDNYPVIDFKSTSILKNVDGYQVTGDLTIKGVTKPITFDVKFGGKAINPQGILVYGYEAEATINREEFNLMWNAVLETGGVLVGKEVKIKVELELNEQNGGFSNTAKVEHSTSIEDNQLDHHTISNQIHQVIAENLTDFVAIIDRNGEIHYASPSFENELQYKISLLQNSNFFEKIHQDDEHGIRNDIKTYFGRTIKKTLKCEFRFRRENGNYMDVEANIITIDEHFLSEEDELLLIVMRDISERKDAEKAVYQLAFHDSLTKLPNRRSLMNELRNEIVNRKLSKSPFYVLFLDLDNFKQINDHWGHEAGDIVLKAAAKRICSVIRSTDIAARFGGDEFVIILKDVQDEKDVITIVEAIVDQIQNPINEIGQDVKLTCSIGVAHYPTHGQSSEELIKNADTALYYVKERGKNDYMFFTQQMEHQSLERRILENALRQAIKEQQFYLEYQPKINMSTNELIGMEALVRWEHPDLGIIPPGKFIPLAEETGLIVPLGEWILKESCIQAHAWQNKNTPQLVLSVNISVRQLEESDFITKVTSILHETGLDPSRLELEITESVLANVKSIAPVLKEIQKLGIRISIDDFGTGYSSLTYIKELPIDTLKIDQSFVKDIHTNRESKEIAKAIINLANSIGLSVIAEGVEIKEHVDELCEDGTIFGQGYYYSRPLKAEAFKDYMKTAYEASVSLN